MPVISSRRYSSYLTPSSVTSTSSSSLSSSTSGVGSYRSSNYSSSSTSTLPLSTSRYNYGNDTYRASSSYRSPLSSSTLSSSDRNGSSTYRSRYDFDENNNSKRSTTTASDSLSTRIGVSSKNDSRSSRIFDTLPPLPPSSSSNVPSLSSSSSYLSKRAPSRSRDIGTSDSGNGKSESSANENGGGKLSLMDDLEFYEKYSPSRYMTKFERARSNSEATITTPSRDSSSPASSMKSLNVTSSTSTPKSEVNFICVLSLQAASELRDATMRILILALFS